MKRLYPPRQRLACNIKDEKQPISTTFGEGGEKAKRKKNKEKQKEKPLNPVVCPPPVGLREDGSWWSRQQEGPWCLGVRGCWDHQPQSFWMTRFECLAVILLAQAWPFPAPFPRNLGRGASDRSPTSSEPSGAGEGGAGLSPSRHRRVEGPPVRVPEALAPPGGAASAHPAPRGRPSGALCSPTPPGLPTCPTHRSP